MDNKKSIIFIVLVAVAVFFLSQATYIVDETEQVVVTQFGKPVGNAITTPGMKFKIPFIHTTHFFDKRYLEWDGDPNQVPTKVEQIGYSNMCSHESLCRSTVTFVIAIPAD